MQTVKFFLLTLLVFSSMNMLVASGVSPLQSEVDKAVADYSHANRNTGIWLLVERNGQRCKAAAGLSDREHNQTVRPDQLFQIGSASKVLTGIAIFQLIEQNKLSLGTKLSTFYPSGEITKLANYKKKNYWNEVTVGMLLQHTSGFIDYLNVYGDDAKAIKLLSKKGKHYTFKEVIHMAVGFGDAHFKPGEKYRYCNTGYIILGDIITRVSGMDWHDYVRKNIMDQAGMHHTYFGSRIPETVRAAMPKGYYNGKASFMPPSLAGSAGEIISNLDDLANFIHAWGSGKLYQKPETLALQMKEGFHQQYDFIGNYFYGYGISKIDGFYGHGGQTFGFESYMAIRPKTGEIYIVGTNDAEVLSMDLFMQLAGIQYDRLKSEPAQK